MNNKNIEQAAKNVSAYLYVRIQLAIRECPDSSKWATAIAPGTGLTYLDYIKAPLTELNEALRLSVPHRREVDLAIASAG